jgi:nucleotide-binding universal stress UspA family protein
MTRLSLSRIVVATDLTDGVEPAVSQGLALARRHGAELVLLHVCEIPESPAGLPYGLRISAEAHEEALRDRLRAARDRLTALRERIDHQSVVVSQVLREGFPDEVIPETARDLGADLIIVGTRGRPGVAHVALGSVAERVVRLGSLPVLVARDGQSEIAGGYRHVVAAVDFSPSTDGIIDAAVSLAAPGARVDVLHVRGVPWWMIDDAVPSVATSRFLIAERDAAQVLDLDRGATLIARHRNDGVDIQFHWIEGRPADVIPHWSRDQHASLIVTGSHGRRGLRHLLLGSVAERTIRNATSSVLVVRTPYSSVTAPAR